MDNTAQSKSNENLKKKKLGAFPSVIEQVTLSIIGLWQRWLSEFSGSSMGLSLAYLM